jgi:hypothetical protein
VLPKQTESAIATLEGPWDVSFQENRGAPTRTTLKTLVSWSNNSNEGIKYFSGTATYTKIVQASAAWFSPDSQLWFDLGDVKNIAEISVNGQPLGIAWKTPFRLDASHAMKPGANTLDIRVTNLWVNRMIGDRQPNATKQYTFTSPTFYRADSPLLPSGLLGPVQIIRVRNEQRAD